MSQIDPPDHLTRHRLAWLALALLIAFLLLAAASDPGNAFLATAADGWVEPQAAEGMETHGPYRTEFRLGIVGAAQSVRLRAMGTFTLESDKGVVLARTDQPTSPWFEAVELTLQPGIYTVRTHHPRWKPVLQVRGDRNDRASAITVTVVNQSGEVPAATVSSRFAVQSSLGGLARVAARSAAFLLFVAIALLVVFAREQREVRRERPALLLALLVANGLLVMWNASRYPLERGLDAEGHLTYARSILEQREIPSPEAGFQTYHPPLYHAMGAVTMAATGSERSLAWLSAGAGIAIVIATARALGSSQLITIAVAAFAPVLLVSEPQATNEVVFALFATFTLLLAARAQPNIRDVALLGVISGAGLLTKYTGVVFAAAAAVTLWTGPAPWRRRVTAMAGFLSVALLVGGAPYLQRWERFGDPMIGNWDDALGHPYRQPPGVRPAQYFLSFGAALEAHPFRARAASLWDSLYVSAIGDGFGRFINTEEQHATNAALAWLALPLVAVAAAGWLRCVWSPRTGLERTTSYAILLGLGSMIRFNLELPYWSAAKAVFLLGLLLPVAVSFARGRQGLAGRCPKLARAVDTTAVLYVVVALATFVYR